MTSDRRKAALKHAHAAHMRFWNMRKSDRNRPHSPNSAGINTHIYGRNVALSSPWPVAMCEERSVIRVRLNMLPDTRESSEIYDFMRDLEEKKRRRGSWRTTTHKLKNTTPALFTHLVQAQ